jgi:hypothetical protein
MDRESKGREFAMKIGQCVSRTGLLASAVLAAASIIGCIVPTTTQAAALNIGSRARMAAAATLVGAACGVGPTPHLLGETGHAAADGVTLRSGTSPACQPPVATINPNDVLRYQCWTEGQDGTWTYLQDGNTGKWGYIRNDLLTNGGSRVTCDF